MSWAHHVELPTMRPLGTILLLVLLPFFLVGCVYTCKLSESPQPLAPSARSVARLTPLVIDGVTETYNGTPLVPMPTYEKAVSDGLSKSGMFSLVVESKLKHQAPPDSARLTLESVEIRDFNGAAYGAGIIFTLVTIGLTSPIPYTAQMTHALTATLVLPSGKTSRFTVTARGHTTFSVYALVDAERELDSKLRKATLQGLLARMHDVLASNG